MPNSFTPQQIEDFLQEFFDVVGTRQYTGARYVPIFGRKGDQTIEWDNLRPYEPLTIVLYQGNSYTSRQYVPVGVAIDNQEFWANTGNYNAQIEQYRRDVALALESVDTALAQVRNEVDGFGDLMPSEAFSATNTIKKYVDDKTSDIGDAMPLSFFNADNTVKTYMDNSKLPYPLTNRVGSEGQVLGTNMDGTTKWQDPVTVTDEQAETYITEWLTDHPEATTTVTNGSISSTKLHRTVRDAVALANAFSSGLYPDAIVLPYTITSGGTFDGNNQRTHICIPTDGFSTVEMVGSANSSVYTFLTSDDYTGNVPFCDGITERTVLTNNQSSGVVTIPADCKYLYVAYISNFNLLPKTLRLDGYDILQNATDKLTTIGDTILAYDLDAHAEAYMLGESVWQLPKGTHICVPVTSTDTIRLIGNESHISAYTLLQDKAVTPGQAPNTCVGYPPRVLVGPNNDTGDITPPSDCHYLCFTYYDGRAYYIQPSHVYINGIDILDPRKLETLQAEIDAVNVPKTWLSHMVSMSTSKQLIHFSLDDVSSVFGDLIANQASYTSVWDCPDMATLKNAHDSTGLCITLNCFTNNSGNDMTQLPEVATWQTELQAAKSWLRFAFHAKDSSHYQGNSMLSDYNGFVTGVLKLTGSYECIDTITRLGYFEGTTENLEELKDATPSIIGFLTADSEGRSSYDFDVATANFLWKHGKLFDIEKELIFIRTFGRADGVVTAQAVIDQIESFIPSACDIVEVFGHEISAGLLTKFETIDTWAKNNGFYDYFPMDIYS